MDVTIAICTWNRADLLRQTLESLTKMRRPAGTAFEVVVVDNNSSDGTALVLTDFSARLPLRSVFECRQGLSHARNTLVREALGRYIVWTDDDVLVEEDWLAGYVDAFAEYPEAHVFGGPIDPWYEEPPPAWFPPTLKEVGGIYLVMETPTGPITQGDVRLPFGANMAFATSTLRKFPFDPKLGRHGNYLASGEESAVIEGILASGLSGHWVPGAKIRHFIPSSRVSIAYMRRWYWDFGASEAANGQVPTGRGKLLGHPIWAWRQAVQHEILYRFFRLTGNSQQYAKHLSLASTAWGIVRGSPRNPTVK